ncbi:hypothetical protein HPP92_027353 [Vanilla planifolia]|uniref:Uncharacterized protein n=1 Tax=Vanilla planifolia TaxID=51239 RepID=A0A835U4K0_VANPL|nr:hypothetical protein HPP92_027353 [Vanilla planifolia]
MEDNQSVVVQVPSMAECSTVVDAPSAYNKINSETRIDDLAPSTFSDAIENSNRADTNCTAPEDANGNVVCESLPDNVAAVTTDGDVHESDASIHSHLVNYDSRNAIAHQMVDYQSSGVVKYENEPDVGDGSVVEQQFDEVYSAEEERLWNAVRTNCLDFNAWTALLEETEKVAEVS